jgi:hypothetical protein
MSHDDAPRKRRRIGQEGTSGHEGSGHEGSGHEGSGCETARVPGLHDLPAHLLDEIYDRLHVHDRLRLNAALPRDARVTKTTRTDKATDQKLVTCVLALKRRRRPLGNDLCEFMARHWLDPTVVALVEEHGIGLDEVPPVRVSASSTSLDHVVARLRTGPVMTHSELAPYLTSEGAIVKVLLEVELSASVEQFSALLCSDVLRPRLLHRSIVFSVVNFGNVPLLRHLLASSYADFDLGASIAEVTHGCGSGLLKSRRCREIILTHLPLDPAMRNQMLTSALHDMDTALWQRYREGRS